MIVSFLAAVSIFVPGISWGADVKAIDQFANKSGYSERKVTDLGSIVYSKGSFAGKKFYFILFDHCQPHGLHTVKTVYDSSESSYASDYSELVDLFKKKYGEPKSYRLFRRPFEDGDGYEWTAIRTGKASIASYWQHPSGDIISIEVSKVGAIVLSYQSTTVFRQCQESEDNVTLNGI